MKKHIGLVIGIIAAVLVLSAAATYVIAGDYIVNNFMLMTKSDEAYFEWLSSRQINRTARKISMGETAAQAVGLFSGKDEKETKGTEGSFSYKISVTDDFCDKFNIYSFKDTELRFRVTSNENEFGLELVPVYGGEELLSVRALADYKKGLLYAQIPTYRDDVVDLSSLLNEEMGDGKTVREYLESFTEGESTVETLRGKDDESLAKQYKKYASYLVESAEDVKVKKDRSLTVGDDEVKVAEVIVTFDAKDLKSLIKGLLDMLEEDEILNDEGMIKAADIRDLVSEIDPSTKITLTEYVNGKGRVAGGELEFSLNATKVAAEFIPYKDGSDSVSTLKITANAITVVSIKTTDSSDDDEKDIKIEAKPGAFVKTAMQEYGSLSLAMRFKGKSKAGTWTAELLDSGKSIASFTIAAESGKYKDPIFTTEGKAVYDVDTLDTTPYFDLPKLIDLALSIVDKIDEPYLNDFINDSLQDWLGDEFTIDTIREYNEQGMFDMFSGSDSAPVTPEGDAGKTNPDPEPVITAPPMEETQSGAAAIPGIVSPDPDEYVARKWNYPTEGEIYRYSHAELAPFAVPGQYKGLEYNVPKHQDISSADFEQAKKELLDNCIGIYTEDETKISVQMGDEIYFDIVPIMGGYAVNAYTFEDCYARIGDYTYGEGLDDMIIGMKVGEVRDLEITLGEMYGDFAGFTGTFRLTLKHIERYIEPSWTESFICGVLGYESLDACSDDIMSGLRADTEVSDNEIAAELEGTAYDNTVFTPLPEDIRNSLRQEYYDNMYDVTCEFGQRPEEYFASAGYSLEDFINMMDADIDSDIKIHCFYAAIAEKENVYLTGAEAAKLVDEYIEYYEVDSFDELMTYLPLDTLIDYEIISRIHEIIYSSAIIKK